MKRAWRIARVFVIAFAVLLLGPLAKLFYDETLQGPYLPRYVRDLTAFQNQSIISVYGAGAGRWQSYFSLHTWIAFKKAGERDYTVYEVIWDRPSKGLSAVARWMGNPDRPWACHAPQRLYHLEGERAEALIPLVEQAIAQYPFQDRYVAWPGPNCNTFIAYIGRTVKELGLLLPPHAVGKDFLPPGEFFTVPVSGSGFQFSLGGLLGITFSKIEGLEIDYLGLNFGLDHNTFSLLYPGIGKIPLLHSQ